MFQKNVLGLFPMQEFFILQGNFFVKVVYRQPNVTPKEFHETIVSVMLKGADSDRQVNNGTQQKQQQQY